MMFSEARQFLIFLQEKCLGSKLSSLSRGGIWEGRGRVRTLQKRCAQRRKKKERAFNRQKRQLKKSFKPFCLLIISLLKIIGSLEQNTLYIIQRVCVAQYSFVVH